MTAETCSRASLCAGVRDITLECSTTPLAMVEECFWWTMKGVETGGTRRNVECGGFKNVAESGDDCPP